MRDLKKFPVSQCFLLHLGHEKKKARPQTVVFKFFCFVATVVLCVFACQKVSGCIRGLNRVKGAQCDVSPQICYISAQTRHLQVLC